VAITSQEDSAVWVGRFDFHELDFVDTDKAQVYHFPRDNHCDMVGFFLGGGGVGGRAECMI
jgi:hypothetical protein